MAVTISVEGAIDLHFHSHPCLFPRIGDDADIALHARQMRMRGLVLKCHHESTVSRAYLLQKIVPDLQVFGSLVLNTYVGGLNPAAVDAQLRLGAKTIYMPTIDAWYHGKVHGKTGAYDVQSGGRSAGEGIRILDDHDRLKPEVYEILDLIAQHDAILGTAHLSPQEIVALVRAARERGVQKILITHPFFKVPNMDLETLKELVRLGAIAEFGYCDVSPMWAYASVAKVKHAIQEIGASRSVLMSDTGQRHNPMPAEALRIFAQCLHEAGIPEADIYTMICKNPADLLNLPPAGWPAPEGGMRGLGARSGGEAR